MTQSPVSFRLRDAEQTTDLAQRIAGSLRAGDCLLLDGQIGAGKTHFARSLIQSLLAEPEDVPSPTFTLVQIYDGPDCEIWHSDLYRLSSLDEIEELGLIAAFEEAITLVEWPDRLEELTPPHALHLVFDLSPDDEDARTLNVSWSSDRWSPLIEGLHP